MSKPRKLTWFLAAVFVIVLTGSVAVNRAYVLPILMYHSVNPGAQAANRLAITPESFDRQMLFFKKHRYNVIPLEDAAALIREGKRIPPKTVTLTFDDGYVDNYNHAFGILKKYKFPATFFIIYDEVGRAQGDRLRSQMIKEMQASGLCYFGSHTLSPEPLINIKSETEVRRQIAESKARLEARVGRRVTLFSYPEGRFTVKIRQMVIDAGYLAAVATNPGKKHPSNDIFALKRLRISSTSDNLLVFAFESSGYYNVMREHRHK